MLFLDTNVLVYAAGDSRYRAGSAAIVTALGEGEPVATTSVAVIEELWHLELSGRVPGLHGVTRAALTLLSPALSVTHDIVESALALPASRLGANDRIHASTCLAHGIDTIVSADRAFDDAPGLRRLDPADDVDDVLAALAQVR